MKTPDVLSASRMRSRRFKAIAFTVTSVAALFLLSLLPDSFGATRSYRAVGGLVLLALTLGALAVPEFEPRLVPKPFRWQVSVGAAGGALIAFTWGAAASDVALAAVGGAIAGAFCPFWIKYV